jgi:plasmid replication initiation protein
MKKMKELNNQIPNSLILAKYNTSTSQKRIVYSILMQIEKVMAYTPSNDDPQFMIPKSMVLDGYSYTTIKKVCKDLIEKSIAIKEDDENEEFEFISPFRKIAVTQKDPNIHVVLDRTIAGIFYEIKKGYTKINYLAALSLESKHAQKLYELFSMKINNFESTIWFSTVNEIKEILGLEGKYKDNKDFRKIVLDTVQREINQHTNLTIEYELEKEGKSYHHLTFYINRKTEETPFQKIETSFMDDKAKRCLERLIELNITTKDIQNKIINEHQEEFWKWNYAVKTNKISIKTNHAGHLLKTLGLVSPKK